MYSIKQKEIHQETAKLLSHFRAFIKDPHRKKLNKTPKLNEYFNRLDWLKECSDDELKIIGTGWWKGIIIQLCSPSLDQVHTTVSWNTTGTMVEKYRKEKSILDNHKAFDLGPVNLIGRYHWVGAFIDKKSKRLYYFDSMNSDPQIDNDRNRGLHNNVENLQNKIKHQARRDPIELFHVHAYELLGEEYKDYTLIRNTTTFQTNSIDCGPWSTMFSHFMMDSDFRSDNTSPSSTDFDNAFKDYILEKTNMKSRGIDRTIFNTDPDLVGQEIRAYLLEHFIHPNIKKLHEIYKLPKLSAQKIRQEKPKTPARKTIQKSTGKKLTYLLSLLTGLLSLFIPLNQGILLQILMATVITFVSYKLLTYAFSLRKPASTTKAHHASVKSRQLKKRSPSVSKHQPQDVIDLTEELDEDSELAVRANPYS